VFSGFRDQQCREVDLREVVWCLADLEVSSAEGTIGERWCGV